MTDSLDKLQETDQAQYLTFTIENEEYGVDIMTVREIKGWTETTRLPNAPPCMRGVINLRGLIIPIFDLRARFTNVLTEASASHVIIILAVGKRNIGILADTVSDILTVAKDEIRPAPETGNIIDQAFISGLIAVDKRMVVLLEIGQLLAKELDIPSSNAA